jgi:hypothetical protein
VNRFETNDGVIVVTLLRHVRERLEAACSWNPIGVIGSSST